ncbi:hypothetical protein, partial [Anoxybacillus suryakundensis]|uniref:hypothetical protein n=1 Tax=Anoxybacillus suryakundensis TaxID=1325335 RepID=UPI0031EE4238
FHSTGDPQARAIFLLARFYLAPRVNEISSFVHPLSIKNPLDKIPLRMDGTQKNAGNRSFPAACDRL